jgi:hypothetical protein
MGSRVQNHSLIISVRAELHKSNLHAKLLVPKFYCCLVIVYFCLISRLPNISLELRASRFHVLQRLVDKHLNPPLVLLRQFIVSI